MDASLWALFASAFVSSTILPGNSEIVLAAVVKGGGAPLAAAIAVATLGNTLGGMTTYGIGRLLRPYDGERSGRTFGSIMLDWRF